MKNPDKNIQMLGPQVALEGSLVFEGTLFMNGHVKGAIESGSGEIVVGEDAVLHADVFVRSATISGQIKGTVRATERIKLHPPARVQGDLYAPNVQIDPGVIFDGNCATQPRSKSSGQTAQALSPAVDKAMKAK